MPASRLLPLGSLLSKIESSDQKQFDTERVDPITEGLVASRHGTLDKGIQAPVPLTRRSTDPAWGLSLVGWGISMLCTAPCAQRLIRRSLLHGEELSGGGVCHLSAEIAR